MANTAVMLDSSISKPSRVLVVRLGAIGDCLRVLPAVARLSRALPDAQIGWVVEDWAAPVVRGNPMLTRIHVLSRGALGAGPRSALREAARLHAELQAERYEVAIDFHARLKSGLVTWASGAPVRIGFDRHAATEANHRFTNVHVSLEDQWENRVLRYLRLLAPLGVPTSFDPSNTGLWIAGDAAAWARQWYQEQGRPPIAVFTGTSLHRRADRWPLPKWKQALRNLTAAGHRAVVFWGPSEMEAAAELAREVGEGCGLAPATSLEEMMAMLGCFRLYLGANTAAMHMAWMQGVACVVLLGGRPARTDEPLPPVRSVMLSAGGAPPQHRLSGEAAVRAVVDISVDSVVEAARRLLETK
ncbi:MAG TPA: glycosyltransferase family 9 protein [Candidatus Limnocylindrales bacterium]|nr:glycosyltransferase family 9 protein [Candidatus Limnocylindrales bacterium]